MKQVVQGGPGEPVRLLDVAIPRLRPGHVLIRTTRSLISTGTERAVVETGQSGYIARARQQPERVHKAMDKLRTDGLASTVEVVRRQKEKRLALGYSSVGVVESVGEGVRALEPGMRVASNGPHAEYVCVPVNLCAVVPSGVRDDQAAFTVVGSIALQGVRLMAPTLGESVAVIGLGLVGLLAVQLLHANGVEVIGFDPDPHRVDLARSLGATAHVSGGVDPVDVAQERAPHGLDGVLVTASSTSDDIVKLAARMCRKRGRIVVTGAVGLGLHRRDFYDKELTLQLSCSYGPGRYDPSYEDQGNDYPIGFVRWTEQRNFNTILSLLAAESLVVAPLISDRFALSRAGEAYARILDRSCLGLVLEYGPSAGDPAGRRDFVEHVGGAPRSGRPTYAFVGAGGFAQGTLLPGVCAGGARIKWIVTQSGTSGTIAAERFGIERSTTSLAPVLEDDDVDAIIVATRHDSHGPIVADALRAAKSVFVEKPLCLTTEELGDIIAAYAPLSDAGGKAILMVGFNRRFAPLTTELRRALEGRSAPLAMQVTCNAGSVDPSAWVHDPTIGGGRLLGEGCHFVDLMSFLAGSPITRVHAIATNSAARSPDTATISLQFKDGSIGALNYFATGSSKFPKETVDVFSQGRVLRINNFRALERYGKGPRRPTRRRKQDKGHVEAVRLFQDAIRCAGPSPTPFAELVNSSAAALAIVGSLETGSTIDVGSVMHGA